MNKTKVCFVNTAKSWGGGEKWHYTVAIESSKDFEVSAIVNAESKLFDSLQGSHVRCFKFKISNRSFLNPVTMFKLYKHFKTENYDAIVLNLPADVKSAGIAAKWAGIKKIIYRRGMPHPIRNTVLNRFLFGKVVTDAIVNSDEIGRSIVQKNPNIIPKDRIHTIYNGINLEEYSKDNIQPLLTPSSQSIILGTAGRCVNQKNQLILVDVMERLKNKGIEATLYLAGTGPLLPDLEAAIKQKNLDDNIELLGFVKDTKAFLASLDIFVFPSHYEGSSNAIIEALAMGVPTVAFDISSMPEMVIDGVTGKLAAYNDVESFTAATEHLIKNECTRKEMSNNSRQLVMEKFNNDVIFKQIRSLLSK